MAPSWKFRFDGRILIIGYGSVARCTLPLIDRHLDMPLSRVTVVDADDHSRGDRALCRQGRQLCDQADHPQEHWPRCWRKLCRPRRSDPQSLGRGQLDDVMAWCQKNGVLYLDTCIEPWAGLLRQSEDPGEASAPTISCATPPGRRRRNGRRARPPPSSPMAPIPASSAISSSRGCSRSPSARS